MRLWREGFLLGVGLAAFLASLAPGSAAGAAAVTPPAGSPDLAAMALRVSDLPAGARVKKQGYVSGSAELAEYDRTFVDRTARIGSKSLVGLESDIILVRTAGEASSEFAELRGALRSKAARAEIGKTISRQFAKGLKADFVRVGTPVGLGLGDESIELTITIGFIGLRFQAALAFLRVERVVGVLLFGGASINLGRADAAALARPVVAHIRAGLVPASVAPPTISGVPAVGQTLTATAGSWSNGPSALGYQWQRCGAAGTACSDIAGETGQTYVLGAGDGGSTIRVAVTAKNRDGAATVVSAATAVVVSAGPAPSNVSPPSILGTAAPGQTLSAVTGSWTNAPLGFAYQWQRCDSRGSSCVDISGATSSSYTVASADTGSTIRVAVTATNAGGSATALSTQTTVVA